MSRGLRWLLLPVVVLPLGWLLFQGLGSGPAGGSRLVGQAAPAFELATLDGETLSSGELAGRPWVLNVWASWCLPACEDEHPVLVDAHARWGEHVEFVGIIFRDNPDDARQFLTRLGDGGWPTLLDPNERLLSAMGVTGPPETYFVDADGVVRSVWIGPIDGVQLASRIELITGGETAQ